MQYPPISRRTILIPAITLFIVSSLTFRKTLAPSDTYFAKPWQSETPAECRAWPEWQVSRTGNREYNANEENTTQPSAGLAGVLGDPRRCLDAQARLDRYHSTRDRNWSDVRWGEVQKRCIARQHNLLPVESHIARIWRQSTRSDEDIATLEGQQGREAVVLRAWAGYAYTEKRVAWLRNLITEVSLHREGKYEVFLLVHLKESEADLDEDGDAYHQALRNYVPQEFRDMAVLFNNRTLETWYPLVSEHGAQDQMYQALQIFSHKFPQFDHVWQLEMDLRFTGNVREALESATNFAGSQSRRNLWERNGAFYIPAIHGSYENFTDEMDREIGDTGVWGPLATSNFEPKGPEPPPRSQRDWGVGEDADLISFLPMIDPVGTNWVYEDWVSGFDAGLSLPRRLSVISVTRSSRRLLRLVSEAQREQGQWVVSEATLETFALLHGLKAVSVPHPILFAKDIKPEELEAEINPGPAHSKAGGHNPSVLYSKDGWFPAASWWQASYWFTGTAPAEVWDSYLAGACLPPMMIHPVKEI
ncbi:hypothetical protein F4778DRAFT_305082 [Xylariomycetidae sp. FL2044]|nr:hypothetical protein F4778DRAFT_305082 [Xylariomycetidae sp. FL2044]